MLIKTGIKTLSNMAKSDKEIIRKEDDGIWGSWTEYFL